MDISHRLAGLEASATLQINAKALEMKANGIEVTSLAVGEPDFPTPQHICEAAKAAIDQGFTRYTQESGIPDLRKAVAAYFNKTYGISATADSVCICNGGKQALYNLFQSLLNPGDEVLVPSPYWVSYPPLIELSGGKVALVPASAGRAFKITVEDLARRRTPATRALLLNSPSNPTGACYSQKEIDALVDWAIREGIYVISDEIYDQLVYDPATPTSVSAWWQNYPEQVGIVNGVSNTYAMTGWRVGYLLTDPKRNTYIGRLQGHTSSNVNSIAQKAALAALTQPLVGLEEMKTAFRRRRDLALAAMAAWPGVACPRPDGAFYLFADVHKLYTPAVPDSNAFCAYMLEEARVALVPGGSFGDDDCVRMSFAVADNVLAAAMDRMGAAVKKLAGK